MNANFLSGVLACSTARTTATKAATAKDAADAKEKLNQPLMNADQG
jgi:hypothetical protein